ncbi:MAG: hypothetical protein M1829_004041 [Trizodia sp. TS-e1964]|nr:MAG: hypothetical protein M1829_004041 [Trizodia sp. TS-e1964]
MFSSALKSFSSNISSNYVISPVPAATSGVWRIHTAKGKKTGKEVSVFIFEKKALDPPSGALGRSGASALKKVHEEVVERLRKEASSLARLRHPNILELVEPVEDTRYGGLQFACEHVTASLAGLLAEKDDQERAGGVGGRSSRFVVEESDGGGRRRREIEIDEIEIQKGLLQIGKGLEFLHESAGLIHGDLTPNSIYINDKADWKISGLGFSAISDDSSSLSFAEMINKDPRLPRSVQLNIDYCSPDIIIDSNVTSSTDMFSLGMLILALYNSPHISPLQCNSSVQSYKRIFSSSAAIPSQSNNFLCSRALPKNIITTLSRLVTRRPAQRMNARDFQQSPYFDNILVSTIRFLDELPAKTPKEKSQFMRGLSRVLNQFPKSVLEKKVLPALLEEMKDRELLALVLQNVFRVVATMPSGRRAFAEKVIPRLREVFLPPPTTTSSKSPTPTPAIDRDSGKEAGLMIVLEQMSVIAENCSGKEFKDDILPIIYMALESPTHSLVDATMRTLPIALPVLDFSTIKNELFPVIAGVFSKTTSLGIKIRGLEAFNILCGGQAETGKTPEDTLNGAAFDAKNNSKKATVAAVLDKYTVQEKLVPLLKAIKTKEPAVMMAALNVFKEVGKIADSEFLAIEALPILWNMSLGPLLDLQQFHAFIDTIKILSTRIEQEQTRKLQELSSSTSRQESRSTDIMSFGTISGFNGTNGTADGGDEDFESLVTGKKLGGVSGGMDTFENTWETTPNLNSSRQLPQNPQPAMDAPTFAWSTQPPVSNPPSGLAPSVSSHRAVTPDLMLSGFATLAPTNSAAGGMASGFSKPLQPTITQPLQPMTAAWPAPSTNSGPWANQRTSSSPSLSSMTHPVSHSMNLQSKSSLNNFTIPPPSNASFQSQTPSNLSNAFSSFSIAPPPSVSQGTSLAGPPRYGGGLTGNTSNFSLTSTIPSNIPPPQKKGLDAYESLL